jgi:preprotein translocase subunit SecB
MKFLDYKVLNASFSLTPDIQPNRNYKIMPRINCTIKKGVDKIFCTFNVDITRGEEIPPFEFNISAVGTFAVEDSEDATTVSIKAAETIFPFVRASIASLTQMANIPAYMLPIIDIASVIKVNKPTVIPAPIESTTLN